MQIQSLLEINYSKWENTKRNSWLRLKQGRDAHLGREGVGVPPRKEELSKEVVKLFIQGRFIP